MSLYGPSREVSRAQKEQDAKIIRAEAFAAFITHNDLRDPWDIETSRLKIEALLFDPCKPSYEKWMTAVRRSAISMAEEGRQLTELEFELRAEDFLRKYP